MGRSLTREKGRYLMGDTKTKKGRRRVNLEKGAKQLHEGVVNDRDGRSGR